jgi:phosphate transport system substrate-binding protein
MIRSALYAAILGLTVFSPAASALEISGSSTIQPIVEKLIPLYTAQGGEAVNLKGGGSGAGIKNASSGASQIGMASRSLKDEEKAVLKHTTIGIDALAIVVNQNNPVAGLSKAQLVDLYSGKIENWKDLQGPDRPVVRISKEVGRSTLELFEHYTGLVSPDRDKHDGKPLISKQSHIIGSNLEAATLVGGMGGAVGYLSVGTALSLAKAGMPIKVVTLDGVMPSEQTIANQSYPIVRELNLAYLNETEPVMTFIALSLGAQGQEILQALGFMPAAKP